MTCSWGKTKLFEWFYLYTVVQNEELLQLKESIQHIETQLQVIEREKEELEKQCVKHKTTLDTTK